MDSGERDVSDMALKGTSVTAAEAASRSAVLKRLRLTDAIFHGLTRTAAFAVLALLSGVIIALIVGAAPALSTFGFSFFIDESWNPVTERFGALAPLRRASDNPMAIACLRLFTFLPLPLFRVPRLCSDMTLCTLRCLPAFVFGLLAAT